MGYDLSVVPIKRDVYEKEERYWNIWDSKVYWFSRYHAYLTFRIDDSKYYESPWKIYYFDSGRWNLLEDVIQYGYHYEDYGGEVIFIENQGKFDRIVDTMKQALSHYTLFDLVEKPVDEMKTAQHKLQLCHALGNLHPDWENEIVAIETSW